MRPALFFSFGHPDGAMQQIAARPDVHGRIVIRDLYGFDETDLDDCHALLIGMHVDQRYLADRADRIAAFAQGGGTIVANGHMAYPFLPGLGLFQPLTDYALKDLVVSRVNPHPVWDGVDEQDLTFRRGVAGFYGRGWHEPPETATVINAIGASRRPVDFIYPVGEGRVLVHGGNDLWSFGGGDTTARLLPQFLAWLFAEEGPR